MREQGRTSWQIVIDQPEPLVTGLFVRDVAGLKTKHTWLPHCAPGITRANGEGSKEAARQWDLWWDRSISNNWNGPDQSQDQLAGMWWIPPNFEALQSAPALQEVVARHFDNARQLGERPQAGAYRTDDRNPRTQGRSIAGDAAVEASTTRGPWLAWNETLAGELSHSSYGSL